MEGLQQWTWMEKWPQTSSERGQEQLMQLIFWYSNVTETLLDMLLLCNYSMNVCQSTFFNTNESLSHTHARGHITYIQYTHTLLLEERLKQTMVPVPRDRNFNQFYQFMLVSFIISALWMAHYQWNYIWSCVIMLFGHRMLVCTQITHVYNLVVMFTCYSWLVQTCQENYYQFTFHHKVFPHRAAKL